MEALFSIRFGRNGERGEDNIYEFPSVVVSFAFYRTREKKNTKRKKKKKRNGRRNGFFRRILKFSHSRVAKRKTSSSFTVRIRASVCTCVCATLKPPRRIPTRPDVFLPTRSISSPSFLHMHPCIPGHLVYARRRHSIVVR